MNPITNKNKMMLINLLFFLSKETSKKHTLKYAINTTSTAGFAGFHIWYGKAPNFKMKISSIPLTGS